MTDLLWESKLQLHISKFGEINVSVTNREGGTVLAAIGTIGTSRLFVPTEYAIPICEDQRNPVIPGSSHILVR
jgi:hypothetical protein